MTDFALMERAVEARKNAYAPYSRFAVGAALLCKNGKVYTGCNIENGAYSPSLCAERVALAKAVSEGERAFVAIAIVGGRDALNGKICPPCGVCRQALSEFCDAELSVLLGSPEKMTKTTLGALLPMAFFLEEEGK